MLFHLSKTMPKVKTVPIHKKHIIGSNLYEVQIYYDEERAFIYDKSKRRLVVSFQNAAVVLVNNDENENALLFSLVYKPDWNDNKDANYSMITSELTIQKVREICNALYKLSINDTISKPTILADKNVFAYTMFNPYFIYYKLVKSKKGLIWEKDGKIKLYNRSTKRKAKYKQIEHRIDDRYYMIGDQTIETDGVDEDNYYRIYDELRIYDLYKRKIVETTSTSGSIAYDYEDHEAFDNIWFLENGIFVIEDKVIVRPIVFVGQDGGAIVQISIEVPDDAQSKRTIQIDLQYDELEYVPIVLFCSKRKFILVATRVVFIYEYDSTQSLFKHSASYDLVYPRGGIDTQKMKLYKYKNFFILLDKTYIIAIYYNKKDFKYYFKHNIPPVSELYKFNVIGHWISRDDNNDCIGVLLESPNHELAMAIYDHNKKEIYFSTNIKYNYPTSRKKDIELLLHGALQETKGSKLVLHLLSNFKFSRSIANVGEEEYINHLNVVMDKDVRVFRVSNNSYLPLSPNEFYSFKFLNYVLTYEQPCLVRFIKHR